MNNTTSLNVTVLLTDLLSVLVFVFVDYAI